MLGIIQWLFDKLFPSSSKKGKDSCESDNSVQIINQQIVNLIEQEKYQQALFLAEQSCYLAKQTLTRENSEYRTAHYHLEKLRKIIANKENIEPKSTEKQFQDQTSELHKLADIYREIGDEEGANSIWNNPNLTTKDHAAKLLSMLNMKAQEYRLSEDIEQSINWVKKGLELAQEYQLKEQHSYFVCLNNLALVYHSQGKLNEAEKIYLQLKDVLVKVLGKEDIQYSTLLNNMGSLYENMGRYEEAEPLYLEAIALREKLLGKDSLDYATLLNNLVVLYKLTGRYKDCEPLLLEAREVLGKVMGENHPYYAASCHNLGELYQLMGRYEEADRFYQQAREIVGK